MITGVDKIINNLAAAILAGMPYITNSYGRAQIFREVYGSHGLVSIPKVHLGAGEYIYALPQDVNSAQSYFIATGPEKYGEFDRLMVGGITRQFAFVFWGNLTAPNVPATLEEIKFDAISVLQKFSAVSDFEEYSDETYAKVFPEFSYWLQRSAVKSLDKKEADTQWLTYPNAGFRLVFTITYVQSNSEC